MSNRDWTIDTWVLYKATAVDYKVISFLSNILIEKHFVAFDHEGHIEKEYRKCLKKAERERKGGTEALMKWFTVVVSKMAYKTSGRLQNKHQTFFKQKKFHRDDWPFVAVCAKTVSKNLVAEESDYTEEIIEYLQKEMNVSVLSIEDSLKV